MRLVDYGKGMGVNRVVTDWAYYRTAAKSWGCFQEVCSVLN